VQTEFILIKPTLRIGSAREAIAFYVDWLGFNLDWEWRRDADSPAIVHVSRDGQAIFLSEDDSGSFGAQLNITVSDLDTFACELETRRPGEATVYIEPPYDIPSIRLSDPFGNHIGFQQRQSDAEQTARDEKTSELRALIRQYHAKHGETPTLEYLLEHLEVSFGLAIEVIAEFSNPPK
jgi:catechol 2,3-dioxygenase-like lactoylglutathione lyase family enzyme